MLRWMRASSCSRRASTRRNVSSTRPCSCANPISRFSACVTRSRSPLVPSTVVCALRTRRSLIHRTSTSRSASSGDPARRQRCDAGSRSEVVGHAGRITGRSESPAGSCRKPARPLTDGGYLLRVKATWYWMRLFSRVPSPGTGSTATVTVLTASVLGASGIGMLTVSDSPAAMRGIAWSTADPLAVGDGDRHAQVGLLRLALVLDRARRSVSWSLDRHAVHAALGQLDARRVRP